MYIEANIYIKYRDYYSIESLSSVSLRRVLSLLLLLLLLLFLLLLATSSILAITAEPTLIQSTSIYSILPTCFFNSA
jgi:hypothetical protein